MHTLAAISSGNPSALTTAVIALGGAVIGGLITAGGQLLVEGTRAKHEAAREAARLKREGEEAASERLRDLVEDAVAAAQRGMTFMESLAPPLISYADIHQYAETVRSTSLRLALHFGADHELVSAYAAVTRAFDHWKRRSYRPR